MNPEWSPYILAVNFPPPTKKYISVRYCETYLICTKTVTWLVNCSSKYLIVVVKLTFHKAKQ